MITLTIDGEEISVPAGTTLLEAARQLGKNIPVLCYHEATTSKGLCRLCVVDDSAGRVLQAACVTPCRNGAQVETRNERVERSRRTILELLNSAVNLAEAPDLENLIDEYGGERERFAGGKTREQAVLDDNPFYVRDYSQCVLCWRCVQVCAEDAQYTFALTLGERGFETHVTTAFEQPLPASPCVYCGQCLGVCPTGALKPKIEFGLQQGMTPDEIRDYTKRPKRRSQTEEA